MPKPLMPQYDPLAALSIAPEARKLGALPGLGDNSNARHPGQRKSSGKSDGPLSAGKHSNSGYVRQARYRPGVSPQLVSNNLGPVDPLRSNGPTGYSSRAANLGPVSGGGFNKMPAPQGGGGMGGMGGGYSRFNYSRH